ncbi:MAG: type II toxin-antitoxin system prevent-host-death family antitoxin [Candidatus Bipolaricaulota bacterium]|nr:type II toxin-antitoxin system prevent-host-death family antitoxin [Candidatus Bipolaricaulota bacterium]
MPKKITSTKLQESIAQVLEDVKECGGPVTITERSRPIAVLIGFESFMALQERLRELEEAQLQQIVAQGRQEHEQGRTRRIKSLRELR